MYADVALFLPIVYRVDIDTLAPQRLDNSQGSAAVGSDEFLIKDLQEGEFDVLFYEEALDDADLRVLMSTTTTSTEALRVLERRSP